MIRVWRVKPPEQLRAQLARNTKALEEAGGDAETARRKWTNAATTRKQVKALLESMATGIDRCMYCGDSLGTAIDHFEPLAKAPLRTFDWHNHLLACSHCNSHEKRELFPRAEGGAPLLVDPSTEDPYLHLALSLSIGEYSSLTPKGAATIEVFGLTRADLTRGRAFAFVCLKSNLRDRRNLIQEGRTADAAEITTALRHQPFADVLSAMLRLRKSPGAATVLGGLEVVRELADPDLDFWS